MKQVEAATFDQLIDRYDVLLLDAYGVLVHSQGAMPGAAARIEQLSRTDKPYYILTNDASKLPETAAERYRGFGLNIPATRIITSGMLLTRHFADHGLSGKSCVVLGPEGSHHYVERAGGRVVNPDEDFEVLVIGDEAGFPFLETVDNVLTGLYRRLDAGGDVALVLPNPDLVYPKDAGSYGVTSGAIALMLEAALRLRYPSRNDLRFARLGKPQTTMFEEALRLSGTRNMVMIGDQMDTDIRGALAFGIDAALFGLGVSALAEVPSDAALRPTYHLHGL